jgi:hypothetical protein
MPWYNYVYIISQLVLAVAGTVVQCCMRPAKDDEEKKVEGRWDNRYEGMV